MKNILKTICKIISILAFFISQNAYDIGATAMVEDCIEVDYNYLCSSSFGELTTVSRVSLGNSRTSSDVFYRNYQYELLDGEYVWFTLYWRFSDNLIFTPNGTDAGVYGSSMYTCTYLNDIPDSVKEDINSRMALTYSAAEMISQPTTSYNCHSYAWYSQNVSLNTVWLDSPGVYYGVADSSYTRVYNPREGDIICYFDLDDNSEYQNVHSGIIVGLSGEISNDVCGDANRYIVQSKWGMNGIYVHKGDICPYTSTYGGTADEVRYYRPRTNAVYNLSKTMDTLSTSRAINGSGSIVDKYGMYELNVTQTGLYTIRVNATKALNNGLYTANMNLVQIGWSTSGAGNYTYAMRMPAGTFYLRTEYTDATDSGTISIHIEPHTHRYDCWTYKDHSTHVECCSCGLKGTATGVHSIRSSDAVNGKAPCLVCGYVLDLRFDVAEVPFQRVAQVSVNGSYILDNGIVVLVDEDVEAYLSGNLVFYNRDSVPSTQ